jgi:hypothetical protein
VRKIIHIDMDAFYASVEQRDNPELRGKPVIVAWKAKRSVVCAASYEARAFGVHSAMPAVRAERLCPGAVFVPPDFTRYRAVSHDVREIFKRHTDRIEPSITLKPLFSNDFAQDPEKGLGRWEHLQDSMWSIPNAYPKVITSYSVRESSSEHWDEAEFRAVLLAPF